MIDMSKVGTKIAIHNGSDYVCMRKAGKLAADVLDYIEDFIVPGVTTGELDRLCHEMIVQNCAIPAPLHYNGFPKSICTSVNHVICHGIPTDDKKLNDGDIVNIDVTVIVDGWHGDSSRTYCVGKNISRKAQRLIQAAYEALIAGIEAVSPGEPFNNIGIAVEKVVATYGYSTVRDYCGHGIGRAFHMPPNVLHYYDSNTTEIMMPGMFFTIEPMVNAGHYMAKVLQDGWTVVTRDKSLSAQFEHTLAVTESGCEIFTLSQK